MPPTSFRRMIHALPWLLLLGMPASGEDPVPDVYQEGFQSISDASLRGQLRFLASPELEGRESGTRGYDVAALYVATRLEELGLQPMGDGGTYYQGFDLVARECDLDGANLSARGPTGAGDDIPLKGQVALSAARDVDWKDPWVFAGFGEGAPTDATDDFHGLPLDGRVVLIVPRADGGPRSEGRSRAAAEAVRLGARRIVIVSDAMVRRGAGLRTPELPAYLFEDEEFLVVYLSTAAADRLLGVAMGTTVAALRAGRAAPRALDGVVVRLRVPMKETRRTTRNVVGELRGSDPTLAAEHVVLGAHLDHVGMHGGKVYPGADDDASGVVAVLGVASAAVKNTRRPRRSLLFAFFAAEEKGLLGSRYFVEHPPVPVDGMVLEVQLDMVGRNHEGEEGKGGGQGGDSSGNAVLDSGDLVHTVGTLRHSDELDGWVRSANRTVGLRIERGNEEFYQRSDQYWFGDRGVPVVFLFAGMHRDYHKPSDTVEKINFAKLVGVTRLAYALSFEVANRDRRLVKNRV